MDIQDKRIRGVGEPTERFKEDGLRMMRAVRFAAQLGFSIEPLTWRALKEQVYLIQNISMERIRDELVKLLLSDDVGKGTLLWESGLLSYILPDAAVVVETDADEKLRAVAMCEKDVNKRLALFLRHVPKIADVLKRLRFDNATVKLVSFLVAHMEDELNADVYAVRKGMSAVGADVFFALLDTKVLLHSGGVLPDVRRIAEKIVADKDCLALRDLKIKGGDLKALGITDGKAIGDALASLLDWVLHEPPTESF